jgi:hypothetical protein
MKVAKWLIEQLKGVTWLDRSKDISVHVSTCTSYALCAWRVRREHIKQWKRISKFSGQKFDEKRAGFELVSVNCESGASRTLESQCSGLWRRVVMKDGGSGSSEKSVSYPPLLHNVTTQEDLDLESSSASKIPVLHLQQFTKFTVLHKWPSMA